MNIISTLLDRELLNSKSKLNILWTNCEDSIFLKFVTSLGHNLITFDDLYYGSITPHIIICNNKLDYGHQCKILSIQFHLPVLLIDHRIKSSIIDLDKEKLKEIHSFYCSYNLAITKKIYESWGGFHDQILSYDINNTESETIWNNLIYQTAKKLFTI